jgi:hypothetical protein
LAGAQSTSIALKAELEAFGAADPIKYQEKRRAVGVARDAAMRWTGEV